MIKKFDLLTFTGLILAWVAILAGAQLEGLRLSSLIKLSAFCIVVLGSFAATSIGFTMGQIRGIPGALKRCFSLNQMVVEDIYFIIMQYTKKARKQGLLVLEDELDKDIDPFLKKCIQLLVDGNSIDNIREIMEGELFIWEQKEKMYENFFRSMGGVSPTLGIIGTVMGLINVMGNLEDPDRIASGIATAFIATFYGITFANLIFLPVASKLKVRREETLLLKEMILDGIISIGSGSSSLQVKDKLLTYLNK